MGGEDTRCVGQLAETSQAAELETGQRPCVLFAEQIGAAGGPDQQATAGEYRLLDTVHENEIAGVLRSVPRCVEGTNRQPIDAVELLAVERWDEREPGARSGGQHQIGATSLGKIPPTGDVVVVHVGFEDVGEGEAHIVENRGEAIDISLGIDNEGMVAMHGDVCRIPETRGANRYHFHGSSSLVSNRPALAARYTCTESNIDVLPNLWSGSSTVSPCVRHDCGAMKQATLRFFGELIDFLPVEGRLVRVDVDDAPSVKDRIEACGVPHTEVDLILVEGNSVDFTYQLGPGDWVSVYPVFRSLDIDGGLRPEPPAGRFVVDVNLGKLAKYLRLLGFDATSDGDLDDGDLAEISAAENRILLTKDRNLLKRSLVVHGFFVREVWPKDQLVEVVRRFALAEQITPFARCMECNGVIADVAKADVMHLLEPLTKQHFDDFRQCVDCGRVFWRGSHFDRLMAIVDLVRRSV